MVDGCIIEVLGFHQNEDGDTNFISRSAEREMD